MGDYRNNNMKSYSSIPTFQAERMSKRLAKHWEHKFPVNKTDQYFEIQMPSATVRLSPLDEHLDVEISPLDTTVDMAFLQKVVVDHLERMGNEALNATWH